jgi:hypothetical protein
VARAVGAILIVVAGGACGDDGVTPPPQVDEGLAFGYTGDRSGVFAAEGDPIIVDTDTGFVLVGSMAGALPLVDLFFLTVSDPAVPGSTDFGTAVGGAGIVAFDFDASVSLEIDSILAAIDETKVYVLSEGTLTLTSLTSSRAAGSVTGSGPRLDGGPRLFVVDGAFDVPVVDASVVAAAVPAGLLPVR